jgi:hypothetical protein
MNNGNVLKYHGACTYRTKLNQWCLKIPPNLSSKYRFAQLDDYSGLRRRDFRWNPPTTLSLRVRVSDANIPGTWGFGFWNDPFSFALGLGGMAQAFPVLPNAAWFFFASPENHLTFRNAKPSNGFLAASFQSPRKSPILIIPELALFPFLVVHSWAKRIREKLSRVISEESIQLRVDVTQWNYYRLNWKTDRVEFFINTDPVLVSPISPTGPLGLVIWIDNQFASFKPSGEIRTGLLKSSTPAWMEIEELEVRDEE